MKKIVILASGNGTNAQAIIDKYNSSNEVQISLVLSNKPQAHVLERARLAGIPAIDSTRYFPTNPA